MGNAYSSAQVNNIVKAGMDVINSQSQKCDLGSFQLQEVDIQNSQGISFENVKFDQTVKIDSQCVSKAAQSTETSQKLQQNISNAAAASISGLNLGNFAETNSILDNSIDLSQKISNTFVQKCAPAVNQAQRINIKDSKDVTFGYVNFNQYQDVVTSCVQDIVNDTKASQDIKNDLTNSATSKVVGLSFGGLLIILLVVLVFIMFRSSKSKGETQVIVPKSAAGPAGSGGSSSRKNPSRTSGK